MQQGSSSFDALAEADSAVAVEALLQNGCPASLSADDYFGDGTGPHRAEDVARRAGAAKTLEVLGNYC